MKHIEIERRFLLKRVPKNIKPMDKKHIRQIYIRENGERVRYRMEYRGIFSDIRCYKTIKRDIGILGGKEEEEEDISFEKYTDIYLSSYKIGEISKIRYIYHRNGFVWEIDSFNDMKLVVCEVELNSLEEEISIPDFIQREIILEITGIRELSNYRLGKINSY